MQIFKNKVLKNYKTDENLLYKRYENFKIYQAKQNEIRKFKEEIYQDGFLRDIFESCLGYTLNTTNPINFSLQREKKNETDGKKADGVIIANGGGGDGR